MASAPRPLTLRKEDYQEAPSWSTRLFAQLNEFFAATAAALARGLTRSENLRSTVKTIKFTTLATAANTFPLAVKHDLPVRPSDIWVGRLRGTVSAAWSFTWELDANGQVQATFQGLANSTEYEVRLILE